MTLIFKFFARKQSRAIYPIRDRLGEALTRTITLLTKIYASICVIPFEVISTVVE